MIRTCGIILIPVGLLLGSLAGCGGAGPTTHTVSGQVTYRDKPVTTGTVMFYPEKGPAATSTIDSNGRYQLQAVAGRHRVSIIAQPPLPDDFNPDNLPPGWSPPTSLVPEKFNRPSTSGVTVSVQPDGLNEVDLILSE